MKKTTMKRLAAILSACAVLTSAAPAALSVSAGKMVVDCDFSKGITSDWGMYKESGGVCSYKLDDGKIAFTVSNDGTVGHAAQLYYDIIPVHKNGVYRIQFDISCTIERPIEAMLQQNGGTYAAYKWLGLDLTPEVQHVDETFTMKHDSDIMAKMVFNCGSKDEDFPEHTVYIDNFTLELVDDSKVDYSATRPKEVPIVVNQVGYKTTAKKTAVFRNLSGQTEFSLVNAETEQVVYTGSLSDEIENASAEETNKIADFTEFATPGTYYIASEGLENSYPFTIGDDAYSDLMDDSIKMLYLQRCGCEVDGGKFSHPACHTSIATTYDTKEQIDVSGGWHDAGDYGRYVVPGAKSVADLLYAYAVNPDAFSDKIGIPESGNGVADVLDEARYELEWMLKMQNAEGGVYHKVTCENFPGYVAPQDEKKPLIITPVSTPATADFCAAMALAAEVYAESDSQFAATCKAAAEKAWKFLKENPGFLYVNPEDITTGDYGDFKKSDTDERYWAAAQMYRMTGDASYLDGVKVMGGMDWSLVGGYGSIALLTMKDADTSSEMYQKAKASILDAADDALALTEANPYGSSVEEYAWGSNMPHGTNGMLMSLAYILTNDAKYANGAEAQVSYLLGLNANAKCFVTGYGTDSPQNPHHRPSMVAKEAMKGMVVGGPDSALEDSAAKAHCRENAPAKCYVDNSESYSTNEITIYWNSPLTCLLAWNGAAPTGEDPLPSESDTEAPTQGETTDVIYGDTNCSGDVTVSDAIILAKAVLGAETLSEQARVNADVDKNGNINSDDVSWVVKSLAQICTLPIED